jgi:hypothetical protein
MMFFLRHDIIHYLVAPLVGLVSKLHLRYQNFAPMGVDNAVI